MPESDEVRMHRELQEAVDHHETAKTRREYLRSSFTVRHPDGREIVVPEYVIDKTRERSGDSGVVALILDKLGEVDLALEAIARGDGA